MVDFPDVNLDLGGLNVQMPDINLPDLPDIGNLLKNLPLPHQALGLPSITDLFYRVVEFIKFETKIVIDIVKTITDLGKAKADGLWALVEDSINDMKIVIGFFSLAVGALMGYIVLNPEVIVEIIRSLAKVVDAFLPTTDETLLALGGVAGKVL